MTAPALPQLNTDVASTAVSGNGAEPPLSTRTVRATALTAEQLKPRCFALALGLCRFENALEIACVQAREVRGDMKALCKRHLYKARS